MQAVNGQAPRQSRVVTSDGFALRPAGRRERAALRAALAASALPLG